jgi:dienelactone hydrolase
LRCSTSFWTHSAVGISGSGVAVVERATIPVEKIDGGLLFLSGDDDQQWPCVDLTEIAVRRRQRAGLPVEHVIYSGAGHLIIPPPYGTLTARVRDYFWQINGGSPSVDAAASEDTWRRVLALLGSHAGR